MPVRNEADGLERAVESIRAQQFPGRLRVYIAVAPSTDRTAQIAADVGHDVTVVPNPAGITPAGLNAAIRAGSAPVVVRVDGHSQLSDGYITRAVETLRRTGAGNVGGMQVPEPESPFEAAVAAATTSWLGTGGATYRLGGEAGPVDTVYLGVFDRSAIESVGLFDQRLVRNQDYELNIRLRAAGNQVWFDPELAVGYRPRRTWRTLARQYYEYGYWKSVVLRMHPRSARLRQLMPPLAIGTLVVLSTAGLLRRRFLAFPVAYLTGTAVVLRSARAAIVVPTIHITWACGVFAGLFKSRAGDPGR